MSNTGPSSTGRRGKWIPPSRIVGVDFSGAMDAGRKIWLTEAESMEETQPAALRVRACLPAAALPGSGGTIGRCLPALVEYLAGLGFSAVGLDFPFSLHHSLVPEPDFAAFLAAFPERYPTPETFRAACKRAGSERGLKRRCDLEARTPFAAHNLRLYRQTWHGIAEVLRPLAARGARVPPMQNPLLPRLLAPTCGNSPWLLETCPASALKRRGLPASYKGRSVAHRTARRAILTRLLSQGVVLEKANLRPLLLNDPEGDVLDSLLCAWIAWRAVQSRQTLLPSLAPEQQVEGWVYC